jgi:hypothetical protein
MKQERVFFSEEKKQKTFIFCAEFRLMPSLYLGAG